MTPKTHLLSIGQVYLSETGEEISTVLANSAVLCIYDTKLMLTGMCHYLLPSQNHVSSGQKRLADNPFNFGEFAIPTLLGLFKKKGSDRNNLEISILGSSIVSSQDLSNKIANENILCAERWLERFGLKLRQKKTGLPEGMQVRLHPSSGGVYLKHLPKASATTPTPLSTTTTPTPSSPFSFTPSNSSLSSTSNSSSSNPSSTSSSSLSSIKRTSIPLRSVESFKSSTSSSSTPPSTKTESSSSSISKSSGEKIKVLIVDDSKTIRNLLSSVLESSPIMQVVGQAADAFEAENLRFKLKPDVMTLDIHMPDKDGVVYLEEVLNKDPMPIVMVSDLSLKEASPVMKALELGAFDYFQKPAASELATQAPELLNIIKAAYESRSKIKKYQTEKRKSQTTANNKKTLPPSTIQADLSLRLIAIGASTGGPEAIRKVLGEFPEKCPPVVIVQHMPAKFTRTFADSLNLSCRIRVKEASNGDVLEDSTAYIAPGGFQMAILEKGGRYTIVINDDPPMNRFKPSVDYTFNSLEKLDFKGQLRAALLTGMGADGAYGLLGLKRKGNFTIAQDEATCVVYGMPRAAMEYNAADVCLPLDQIADSLVSPRKKSGSQSA